VSEAWSERRDSLDIDVGGVAMIRTRRAIAEDTSRV
jgi:hypothetical protein